MTTATITLIDGTVHEADIESVSYRDAKVHESRSHSYSSMPYPYYRSQSTDINTPVVTREAEIRFRVGDQQFSVGASKVISVAVPEGYVRYEGRYLTSEQRQERIDLEMKFRKEYWGAQRDVTAQLRKDREEVPPPSLWDKFLGWFR